MAVAAVSRPLISLAFPQDGVSRLLMQAVAVIAGTALLALSAKVTVPFWPVPMTLQVLAVFLIGAAYGRDLAFVTLLTYLAQGAVGLPVFATGAGLAYMAGPTGGYLVGFVVAATIAGWAADRGLDRHPVKLFAAMLVGEVAILGLGAAWLAYLFGAEKAIAFGVGPFIVTDLVKVALAAAIVPAAWNLVERFRG
ncbi:biotin transporter BioY [Mesorhizobium sp. L-8-10]|uniref:biotin transporter BioY n=1 Tax=Mesorhizobium sp. L-8-10 TaxID=2744523 RepID=UPI0019259E53|nr:biotin transporter BioY [Mesorhizobium sp. L-8-10]BCH34103.1 biotin transporter BioY [Mesorhizobium sp. L-8-10]